MYHVSSGDAQVKREKGIQIFSAIDSALLNIRALGFQHKWVNSDPEQGEDRSQKD